MGPEGEGEEAVRERLAKEYRWTEESSATQGGGDDDDPLDAFMAGIEVSGSPPPSLPPSPSPLNSSVAPCRLRSSNRMTKRRSRHPPS